METVSVRVRDCACPGTPHGEEGDCVFLAAKLGYEGGLAAQADIYTAAGNGRILEQRWRMTFVQFGAVGWNWTGDDGKPLPFDVAVILEDFVLASPVGEKADDLYGDTVVSPLLRRRKRKSLNGSTDDSISPKNGSNLKSPAPSSPAITAGSPPLTG